MKRDQQHPASLVRSSNFGGRASTKDDSMDGCEDPFLPEPSDFGLEPGELMAEVQRLRRGRWPWANWEIRARFTRPLAGVGDGN